MNKIFALLTLLTFFTLLIQDAEAHQLFNSEEEKIAGYKIAVSTDPEIPGPGNPSRLLVAITDYDGNDMVDVRAGLKIFKDDIMIHEVIPAIYSTGHIDLKYTFPESGLYIVEVDIIDPIGKEISSKFNIGIIQTFGYIFYSMVILGSFLSISLIVGIYFMKRRKAKQVQS
jgi:hypothetical protein